MDPLKGDVIPDSSDFTVGKVKVEVRLSKALHAQGRWGKLLGDPTDADGKYYAFTALYLTNSFDDV